MTLEDKHPTVTCVRVARDNEYRGEIGYRRNAFGAKDERKIGHCFRLHSINFQGKKLYIVGPFALVEAASRSGRGTPSLKTSPQFSASLSPSSVLSWSTFERNPMEVGGGVFRCSKGSCLVTVSVLNLIS